MTNPDAEVTLLAPDHLLLAGPNAITVDDFAGWNKERGLYFAAEWAPEYVPLLAMSDGTPGPLALALERRPSASNQITRHAKPR